MADSGDITLGELARNITALEGRINKQFDGVQKRFDNLSFVPREVYEVENTELRGRIDALEEARRWMARTVVASLALPILVALVVAVVISR